MKRNVQLVCLVAACVAMTALPVHAQTGTWSVAVGYQGLKLTDTFVRLGFNVDVARELGHALAIVGDFGHVHHTAEAENPHTFGIGNLGAGVRWGGSGARAMPFVQIVGGAELTSSDTDSDAAFMLQPGAGVYLPASRSWGVQAQIDYRAVFFREDLDSQWRVVIGARWQKH